MTAATSSKAKNHTTATTDNIEPTEQAAPGEYTFVAGLDIGNGYVKGVIERADGTSVDEIDAPSVAATITSPANAPDHDSLASSETSNPAHWYNRIDASFASSLVPDTYRRLLGKRALSGKVSDNLDEFELVGNKSKAQQDLSKVLVLGLLAGKAVRDYVRDYGELPSPDSAVSSLTVRAVVALALPINEYDRHRHLYMTGFTGAAGVGARTLVHQVRLNNFETPVTVSIVFESVIVLPEGASAQFAINHHGKPLMEAMLADATDNGVELPEGVGAEDLLAATETIGIDVGEGTVNFPVFTEGGFNSDASRTMKGGYGTVLENALSSMTEQGVDHTYTGRKQLASFLQGAASKLKARERARTEQYVAEQSMFFSERVAVDLSKVLSAVGSLTEVIYVYGGGSGALRESLYPELVAKVTEMGGENAAPVLYLDAAYSRGLNREGLIIAARNRATTLGVKA